MNPEFLSTQKWVQMDKEFSYLYRFWLLLVWLISIFLISLISYPITFVVLVLKFFWSLLLRSTIFNLSTDHYEELFEYLTGFGVDLGAYLSCYCMSFLGYWPLNIMSRKPTKQLSEKEWLDDLNNTEKYKILENGIKMVGLSRLSEKNGFAIPPNCVIVCNHMSMIDGFVDKATLFPIVSKTIMKKSIWKAPVVGPLLILANQCWVDRGVKDPKSKKFIYERSEEIIKRKVPLVVYPEGTRRMFGRMNPFKLGIISLVVKKEWPILVSVIHGTHKTCPPRTFLFNKHPIYKKYDNFFFIADSKKTSPIDMANKIKERMLYLFDNIPGYDYRIERPIETEEELKKIITLAQKTAPIRVSLLG